VRITVALALFLLCGTVSVAGVAAGQPAARVWFAPVPAETVVGRAGGFDGSRDFMSLFDRDASWGAAAKHVAVFKLYGGWVANEASLPDLRLIVSDLRRRGIALAVEDAALVGRNGCGEGVEGFTAPDEAVRVAERVRAAGGTLDYVAVDSPFREGTLYEGPLACHFSAEEDARQVAAYAAAARSIFPRVVVGDIEALPPGVDPGAVVGWLDTYRRVAGASLPFLHLDVNYLRLDWPEVAGALERAARARGIRFGIIYDGEGSQLDGGGSDRDWTAEAERRFTTYEAQYRGHPDDTVLQSWVDHPDYALPETQPGTFTWLIDRYLRPRPSLTLGRDLRGRLTGAGGQPIAGARVFATATGTSGAGTQADSTLTGTVPAGAAAARVGLRVNAECGCWASADVTLAGIRWTDGAGTRGFDFSAGISDWSLTGDAPFSFDASGLHVTAAAGQTALLDSPAFAVSAGTRFAVTFGARVPPSARGSGYFVVLFLRSDGRSSRRIVPLEPAKLPLVAAITARDGTFRVGAPPGVLVETWYRGDARRFAAYASRVAR
jgi:hypothetical protein